MCGSLGLSLPWRELNESGRIAPGKRMSEKSINVLITAASRRVALIRGFQSALSVLGIDGKVIFTDIDPLSPCLYLSD